MPDTKRCLKVFVGSPGDVGAERDAVSEVITRLNPQLDHVYFDPVRWEWHPHARDTRQTPQAAIADRNKGIPRPGECEVAVFIFWTRIGTVLDMTGLEVNGAGDQATGTTWEFFDALESDTPGRRVLTYRKTSPLPHEVMDDEDGMAQVQGVSRLFKSLRGSNGEYKNYTYSFRDLTEFKDDLREQLQVYARDYQDRHLRPAGSSPKPMEPIPDLDTIPFAYLHYLRVTYRDIDLSGAPTTELPATRLPLIYVPALTAAHRSADEEEVDPAARFRQDRDRPAHELLLHRLDETSLYVPGHAGQGKTTFCQWLMYILASGSVPAMPFEDECEQVYREALPDSLANRLPLLVRLSDFWRTLPLESGLAQLSCLQIENALWHWLDQRRPGGLESERVRHHLERGTLLLVLDGLDEVPETDEQGGYPRVALLNGLPAAVIAWTDRGNRLLLTSRPYALNFSQVGRLGLDEAPLELLPPAMQALFVKRWLSASGKPELIDELLGELQGRSDLRELRENPLLLTAICIKYHNQKRLPQDIHDLYQGIVEQVLYNRFPGAQTDRDRIARRLETIALGMHRGREGEPRNIPVRDISHQEIDSHLTDYADANPIQEGDADLAGKRRDQLLSCSGLLLPLPDRRGGFSHWTFQDYFAAERLYRLGEPLRNLLTRHAGHPQWHGALRFLLARALAEKGADQVMPHLDALIPQIDPTYLRTNAQPALLLGMLLEIVQARTGGRLGEWIARFRQICLDSLHHIDDPSHRNALFTHLATIGGDDRPGVGLDTRGLPDIDWVEIPAGPFLYGTNKKKITLDAFAISRYPITHAQFQAFIDAGGYDDGRWWDGLQCKPPEPARWPIANRPRENVSWYDAIAFCNWLSAETGKLITLPTEQQWEKAARGKDGREYPWGDKFLSGHANCDKSRKGGPHSLQQTSAVGLYPQGNSPYKVADMAGNVEEWCRDFYYNDKKINVLRCGSWFSHPDALRAAIRFRYHPDSRNDHLGFRVVCVPRR